ncbi:MAG: hypothetical protein ACP5O1_06865 [Phycisphaerae bacterium]
MNDRGKFCGMTRMEAAVFIATASIFAAVITFKLASWNGLSDVSSRVLCEVNIRGLVQATVMYAENNQGCFPSVPPTSRIFVNGLYPRGAPVAVGTINPKTNGLALTHAPAGTELVGSPLACMWLLVVGGYVKPVEFICPSDPVATVPSVEYLSRSGRTCRYYEDFGMGRGRPLPFGQGESYSIAFPWVGGHVAPWWNTDVTSQIPIISDMAPMQDPTAPGKLARNVTVSKDNTYGRYIYNSGNHGGDGENVGFGDGHVTWETNPYVGVRDDNIFTYGKAGVDGGGTPIAPRLIASVPKLSAKAPYDIVMVPTRNVQTGRW